MAGKDTNTATRRSRRAIRAGVAVAAAFATLVVLAGGAGAHPAAVNWTGVWDTTRGTWVLCQSGTSVTGRPGGSNPSGLAIRGTASGSALTGSYRNKDGPIATFRLRMSASGRSFTGYWRLNGEEPTSPVKGSFAEEAPCGDKSEDTERPTVKTYKVSGHVKAGSKVELQLSMVDDSGKGTATATLYDGGKPVRQAVGTGSAHGQTITWTALLGANLIGPLYFCAWAKDAAGNKSLAAPYSSCQWISLLVPIGRVSNGCGGGGWNSLVKLQNYLANTSTYVDSNASKRYTVRFVDACNLHDAGYGGHTVADRLRGGVKDFRTWTRRQVDEKFLADMRLLCRKQIPASAKIALASCLGAGSVTPVSIGALARYQFVRTFGDNFFDANLRKPGTQTTGPRDNS